MLGFRSSSKPLECSRPKELQVGAEQGETVGIDAVDPLGAGSRARDQPGVAQDPEVQRDSGPRHRQFGCQFAHRTGASSEQIQDGASGAVAEGVQHVVAPLGVDPVASVSCH